GVCVGNGSDRPAGDIQGGRQGCSGGGCRMYGGDALWKPAPRTATGKGVTMRIVRDRKEHDGFFWVEQLLVNGRPFQETAQDLDTLSGISGAWEVRFEVLSPLFIGSGEVDVADEPGVPTMHFRFARRGESVIVPGTSLKGVIRSLAEMLSPSCLGGEDHDRCPACLLFGTLGRRGRVTFED